MKKLFLPLLLLCLTQKASANEDQLKDVMQHLSDSLLTLMPIVQSAGMNQAEFTKEVLRLQRHVHEAESHFKDQPVTARISYEMLKERIDEVSQLSEEKSLITARSVLSESLELCASCHTRDRQSRLSFGISKLHDLDEFQAGEFSFLSRDYESALVSYKNFLATDHKDAYRRSQALDRMLAVTTEIYGDMEAGSKILDDVVLVSESEKYRVDAWQKLFSQLKDGQGLISPLAPENIAEMDRFLKEDWPSIQSFMGWNEQQAYWMLIRQKLNGFLQSEPKANDVPVLLYWLAVADRSTHFLFYESLSRRYLEQCIREYTAHDYAQKCFEEFELLMIVSFSGSGGINMPVKVREEINELRRLAYQKN